MSEDKYDALRIIGNRSGPDSKSGRAYILLNGARLLTNIPHCCTYALDLSQIQCGRSTFQTRLRDNWLVNAVAAQPLPTRDIENIFKRNYTCFRTR